MNSSHWREALPRYRENEISGRLQRLKALMKHLTSQIRPDDNYENLIAFLNRRSKGKGIASPLSVKRWVAAEQFPGSGSREKLAEALGVEFQALERFLLHGQPSTEEFLNSLPPIPREYQQAISSFLKVDANIIELDSQNQNSVLSAIYLLSSYLSLEKLVELGAFYQQALSTKLKSFNLQQSSDIFLETLKTGLLDYAQTNQLDIQSIAEDLIHTQAERKNGIPPKTLTPVSTIGHLIAQEQASTLLIFSGIIKNPETRINELIKGAKPTEEELGLLVGVLPVSREQLMEMYSREFKCDHQGCFCDH